LICTTRHRRPSRWSYKHCAPALHATTSAFRPQSSPRTKPTIGLRWADIDLDAARLSIRQTVTLVDRKIIVANRTKTGTTPQNGSPQ
jgi:hypothetical protein